MCAVPAPIIEEIVDQHYDEAAYLWSQRDAATTATNYSLSDLAFLDERLEAHIDGLRVAGDYGWGLCEAGLDPKDPGTVFTASVIAFESADKERIDLLVGVSGQSRAAFRAVVSGLGWMKVQSFNSIILGMVSAKSLQYRRLGIAACGIRRLNPKTYLDQAVNSSDLFLKTMALKTAGSLKRLDLLPELQKHLQHEDHSCRFEAARSALLLGDRSASDTLGAFVNSNSDHTLPAMQVALRVVDGQTSKSWLKAQSRIPELRRAMFLGIGMTGDAGYVPMLIKRMSQPEFARVAGYAFSMITGIDLQAYKLDALQPEGFEAGPNDDPEDGNVDMDADEDLDWPHPELVAKWWEKNGAQFNIGTRYLAGNPVSPESCAQILQTANQSTRHAASIEIALSSPAATFINVKAPGYTQYS